MELQYYGANVVKITTKKSTLFTDPFSDIAKPEADIKKADKIVVTQSMFLPPQNLSGAFIIDSPGEYEFADLSVKGIAAQPHTGADGDKGATMYRISSSETTVLLTGHTNANLSESQLEEIGQIDIVILPVGGGGYTLDGVEAAGLVRAVEPKLVIPVHYSDGLKYEVPQQELEVFIKELGAHVEEPTDKLKPKSLPEQLTVQPLIRQ